MTMTTERLIDDLSTKLRAVPRRAVERRLALSLIVGMVVSGLLMAGSLGIRADLASALRGFAFWMKTGYVGTVAALCAAASVRLAHPDTAPPGWLWLLGLPVLVVAVLAGLQMANAPPEAWAGLWLGKTWTVCPFLVFGLSIPIFVALTRGLAKLAPTRLRATGTLAGLTAGASAALVYCLHCPESTAGFLLVWYSAGIGLTGLLGALAGPRLLRW